MTMLTEIEEQNHDLLVDIAIRFKERFEIAIAEAISNVDPTSPRAEESRARLRSIRASLPECSLRQFMKVVALDIGMNGACIAMIEAALGCVGPEPLMLDVSDASDLLDMFSEMIAAVEVKRLH